MIVALFANITKNHSKPIAIGIQQFLKKHGIQVVAEDKTAHAIGAEPLSSVNPKKIDFLISLGGDGTILRIFHSHPELDAPILGVNLGSLGFMADITIEEVYPSLENVLSGNYQVQNRIMIEGETSKQERSFAINEVVVHRGHNPSLIDVAIYIDGKYLNTFSADGIIVSTPNGSTAYSLAAGGPIIDPELEAFVLTPICPHTISNRPFVLMPKEELELRYISDSDHAEIIFDGFSRYTMRTGEFLRIRRSERAFRLINMLNYDYFATVRSKLGWTGRLKK